MASSNCYFAYNSGTLVDHTSTGPCGPSKNGENVSCCDIGDVCLEGGICAFGPNVTKAPWAGASGYYMAGCTDPNFRDPACAQNCTAYANSDIVYDWDVGAWRCCGLVSGSSDRNCSSPQGQPMGGPAPGQLKSVAAIVATGSYELLATAAPALTGAAASAAATGSNGASSFDQQTVSNTSASISPGVAAGIAVGAFSGLLLLVIGALLLWRSRRKSRLPAYSYPSDYQYYTRSVPGGDLAHTPYGGLSDAGMSQVRYGDGPDIYAADKAQQPAAMEIRQPRATELHQNTAVGLQQPAAMELPGQS